MSGSNVGTALTWIALGFLKFFSFKYALTSAIKRNKGKKENKGKKRKRGKEENKNRQVFVNTLTAVIMDSGDIQ